MTGKRLFGLGRALLVCVVGMGCIGCSDSLKEVCKSSPTDGRIHVAALCGDSAGFGVGYGGAVQYTKDGGKTWIAGTNRCANFPCMLWTTGPVLQQGMDQMS